jgi:uncharacterized membrane protein
MEQLRLGLPPRDATNPMARLLFGMIALVVSLGLLTVVLFVVLPLAGIIVSAAVGGVILALAGLVMMIPFLIVTATVFVFFSRSGTRRHSSVRTHSVGR